MSYDSFLGLDMSYEEGFYDDTPYDVSSLASENQWDWAYQCPYNLYITVPVSIAITAISYVILRWLKKRTSKPENTIAGVQFGVGFSISYGVVATVLVIITVHVVNHLSGC